MTPDPTPGPMTEPASQPMRSSRLSPGRVLALAGIVALAAVGLSRFRHHQALAVEAAQRAEEPPRVRVLKATDASAEAPQRLPGQTAAWHVATIYGRVNGFVAGFKADLGDVVRRGETLASIDTPELDAELHAARAKLDAARAAAALARTTDERWRDSPKGTVADQERDAKHAEHEAADAQVRLEAARVNQFEVLTGFKHVLAPFDGRISERDIDVGTLVTAGSASTPLYRVVQDAPLRVYASVPQSAIDDLSRGTGMAEVYVPGDSAPVAGRLARTSAAIDTQTRTLKVEIDLPNADHRILPGAYVEVALHLGTPKGITVPAQTLRAGPSGTDVLRVDAQSRIHVVPVRVVRDDGKSVTVLEGLRAGDRLIVNPSDAFRDGDTVRVVADPAPEPSPRP